MAKYFSAAEFKKCKPACSIEDMDAGFLARLDAIREAAGIPLVLNSAYRSPDYEIKHGRKGTSAHTLGVAVDIRCNTYQNRYKIVRAALACGITRIGVAKTYVHLDASKSHAQEVIWDYYG